MVYFRVELSLFCAIFFSLFRFHFRFSLFAIIKQIKLFRKLLSAKLVLFVRKQSKTKQNTISTKIPARIAGAELLFVRKWERPTICLRRLWWHVINGFVVQTVTFVRCVWAIFIMIAMPFLRNAFIGTDTSANRRCKWKREFEKLANMCLLFSFRIDSSVITWYLLEFVLSAECARCLVFGIWTILDVIASETSVNEIKCGVPRRVHVETERSKANCTIDRTAIAMECTFCPHIEIHLNGNRCLWSYLCIHFHRLNRDRCHSRMWPSAFQTMSQRVHKPPEWLSRKKNSEKTKSATEKSKTEHKITFANSFARHEWSHPFRSTFWLQDGANESMRTHRTLWFDQILKVLQILWR